MTPNDGEAEMAEDPVHIHTARAMAELDSARAARCPEAARAHYALSGLHFGKARALSTGKPSSRD
jgi:hypothetical protein